MEKIGIAIVGCGNMAQSVHLPTLSKLPNVKILALCDTNKSKAKILAEKYGVPFVVRTPEELGEIEGISAAIICTTTDAHVETALACIAHGYDILVEKPLARTYAEAKQIVDASTEKNVKLMVGMNHRFRHDTLMLKNTIERGDLGDIYYAKTGWLKQRTGDERWFLQAEKSGGGVMLDLGVVVLDLLLWVFGYMKVRAVSCSMFQHQTTTVEDVVIATLHFENNSVATLETSWSLMRPEDLYYCNVFGQKGSAFVNPFKFVKREQDGFTTFTPEGKVGLAQYQKSYETELKSFINAVAGLTPIISTGWEALERMKIVEALYRSSIEKREIRLD